MVSTPVAALLAALLGASSPELLDFTASWCGPCRSMQPKVEQLAAAGYAVRQVDIDREPELARKFGVTQVPCFVLVADGRERDRIVGPTSVAQLRGMFERGGGQQSAPANTKPTSLREPTSGFSHQRLLAASVRLTVMDDRGQSHGSGTLIDARDGEALIVTCGHLFRDSGGRGKISVDLFDPAVRDIPGRLVSYDLKRDIGLVVIRPPAPVAPAAIAPTELTLAAGMPVASVGCDGGGEPTVAETRVNGVNGFLGPPNVQVAGQPVQGRSGGGLFTAEGQLVGVCNAADPQKNEGLYAAAATIREQMDVAGLGHIYDAASREGRLVASTADVRPAPRDEPKPSPGKLAAAARGGRDNRADATWRVPDDFARPPHASIPAADRSRRSAEVICIVRSLDDPSAESEVVVLDRVSSAFLEQLTAERQGQAGRHLTSQPDPDRSRARSPVRTATSRHEELRSIR